MSQYVYRWVRLAFGQLDISGGIVKSADCKKRAIFRQRVCVILILANNTTYLFRVYLWNAVNINNISDKTTGIISRFLRTEDSQTIPDSSLTEKQMALEKFLSTIPCMNHGNARLMTLKYSSLSLFFSR